MANPLFIPIQFAKNGIKNVIQKVLQSSQDQEDATWNSGWGQITMIPKEDGGLAPKGQDFNGILYTMSDHLVHRQNGQQILFSADVVSEYGGYAKDSIIQADDGLKHFRSLIDNNTFNPNTQSIANRWEIYAGAGSVPSASSTIAGVIRVINNLTSTDVGAALSANMGRILNDAIGTKLNTSQALGVGQTWKNVTSSRVSGSTYTNNTGKPIMVNLTSERTGGDNSAECQIMVDSMIVGKSITRYSAFEKSAFCCAIVPSGASYIITWVGTPTISELR